MAVPNEVHLTVAGSDDSAAMITSSSSSSSLEEMVDDTVPSTTTTNFIFPDKTTMKNVKGGDLLFFEGRPFHYLEHLEGLPPPSYPSSSVMSLAAVFTQTQQPSPSSSSSLQQHQQQQQQPTHVGSLARMEPDRLLSYNMCAV
jgi:hypothetical protein